MKILIVKTSSLGDIVQTYPVLSYLRSKWPNATIDWVVEGVNSSLVHAHPYVDHSYLIETKRWRKNLFSRETWREVSSLCKKLRAERYDLLFDLQGNTKSGAVTFLSRAAVKVGFGNKSVSEWPNLLATGRCYNPPLGQNIRLDYLSIIRQHLQDAEPWVDDRPVRLAINDSEKEVIQQILAGAGGKIVLVCPGSAWKNKQMTLAALSQLLKKFPLNFFLFAWGTLEEKCYCQELQKQFSAHSRVIERLSLPALQNLMWDVSRVISMDSLPLHLAGSTPTATLSLFGPSLATKYKPLGPQHIAFQGVCPYGQSFEKRCPKLRSCPTGACLREADVDEINLPQIYQRRF